MDNLSYRNNRSAPQRATSNESPTSDPAAQPELARPTRQAPQQQPKRGKKKWIISSVVAALLVLATIGWVVFFMPGSAATAIDSKKYQAVFFTNGQVYFGKLKPINDDYMRLTSVYYLQTKTKSAGDETKLQSASKQNASDVELIKLGNEIHGPSDEMIISRDQMLFFENLKSEGSVSQTITNNQNKKTN